MTTGTLVTFGYQKLPTPELLHRSLERNFPALPTTVFDIRFYPMARNPAWKGRANSARSCFEAGIPNYEHVGDLGNVNYQVDSMAAIKLKNPAAVQRVITPLLMGEDVAIMCVCAVWTRCHRMVVLELIREAIPDLRVVHL